MVLLSKVNADIHRTLFNLSRIRKVVFRESLFLDLEIDVVKLIKVPLHLAEEAQANSLCIDCEILRFHHFQTALELTQVIFVKSAVGQNKSLFVLQSILNQGAKLTLLIVSSKAVRARSFQKRCFWLRTEYVSFQCHSYLFSCLSLLIDKAQLRANVSQISLLVIDEGFKVDFSDLLLSLLSL